MQFSVRNLNVQIFGQNWGFFGEVSAKSGIWMKCSHHSHDVRTTCFFQAVFSHGFSHVFARFSHDLFVQGFCLHGCSHVLARCSHDVRTQAVCQRVCARFDRNSHKSGEIHSFRLAHSKFFEFFAKKTLTN